MEGRVFNALNNDGEEIECEVIMLYHDNHNDIDYIFYTDNSYDHDGTLNLYASRYLGENDGGMELEEIEDEAEWKILDKALEQAKEGLKDERR